MRPPWIVLEPGTARRIAPAVQTRMSCSFSFPACAYPRALLGARGWTPPSGKRSRGRSCVHRRGGVSARPGSAGARGPWAASGTGGSQTAIRARQEHASATRASSTSGSSSPGRHFRWPDRKGSRAASGISHAGIVSSLLTVRQGLDFMTPMRGSGWGGMRMGGRCAGSCLSAGRGSPGDGEDGSRASRLSRGSRGAGGTGSAPAADAVLGRVFRRFHALARAAGIARARSRVCAEQ
jgi:hypothetical protein